MVLRLFNLLEGSNHEPYAVRAISSILRLPHVSFGSDVGKSQLLHHFRFSIDYLRRAHLLTPEGKPVDLFGIASHLYYTEPSNLAMVVLLQNGVIHEICSQASSVDAERDLMALLCHLFGRRYLPEVYATISNIHDLVQKGPSRVLLAPLDKLGPDNRLPLSGCITGPSDIPVRPQTALISHLAKTAVQLKVRSIFVATSGHDDKFGDVGELAHTVRYGIWLNEHAIPTVEHILDPRLPLNAYLYDFFVHGQVDALVNMNGIRRGDVWYALEEFHLVLTTIRGQLENLLLSVSKKLEAASHEAERDGDQGNVSEDNEHLSADSSEYEETEGEADQNAFQRPRGVRDKDWKVYEVVNSITNKFGEKFKAMWA